TPASWSLCRSASPRRDQNQPSGAAPATSARPQARARASASRPHGPPATPAGSLPSRRRRAALARPARSTPTARSALAMPAPPAVEFGIVDLLPGPEIELAGGDGNNDFVVHQQALQMRIAIGLAGAVVLVVGLEWGEALEPGINIGQQALLGIVDPNAGGDVHRRNQRHAFAHARLPHLLGHPIRDVEVLARARGVEGEVSGVGFHVSER